MGFDWMKRRRLTTWCVFLAFAVGAPAMASAASEPRNFAGPFHVADALTFYVVNASGDDFTIRLQYYDKQQATMDRPMLIRVFDPEEEPILRHDDPGQRAEGGLPPRKIDLPIHGRGAGVYQVIV